MRGIWMTGLILISFSVLGQDNSTFRFLNIPSHARLTGLGGILVSLPGEDVNLISSNPALNLDTLNGMLSASVLAFPAGINKIQMAFQTEIAGTGSWVISAEHIGYGDLDSYDPAGEFLGTYTSGESMVMIGKTHRIDNFSLGGSIKLVNSSLAGYSASALCMDLGGVFIHPEKDMSVGLVFKNIGFVLHDFEGGSESSLPFDVQTGITFKPEFMPFRFSFTAFELADWKDRDNEMDQTGDVNKVFRHLNVGTEILLTKNVHFLLGYNHLRHQELKLDGIRGSSGWSYGVMFYVKSLEFTYSYGGYHIAGGGHNFTISFNTARLLTKN